MSKEEKAKVVIFHRLFDDSVCLAIFFLDFTQKGKWEFVKFITCVAPQHYCIPLKTVRNKNNFFRSWAPRSQWKRRHLPLPLYPYLLKGWICKQRMVAMFLVNGCTVICRRHYKADMAIRLNLYLNNSLAEPKGKHGRNRFYV